MKKYNPTKLDKQMMALSTGQMFAGDFDILMSFAKDMGKGANIVELGTARGLGAMILSSSGGKVTTIDIFTGIETGGHIKQLSTQERYRWVETISHYLEEWSGITVIEGYTKDKAECFNDNSIDLLFIDADHRYSGVKDDYNNWVGKVKPNGYILFHDYSIVHQDVKYFCDELLDDDRVELVEYDTSPHTNVMRIFKKIK